MDNKGIMSGEIIVLLILIVLIIGVTANFTERNSNRIAEKISDENMEKRAAEFCDGLIKNPGTPKNWNELRNKNSIMPGLAITDENNASIVNSVDYDKLMALKGNYKKIIDENVFDNGFKSAITLAPLAGTADKVSVGDEDLENPATANRIVMCNFLNKYAIGKFEKNGPCNYYHLTAHSCNHFKIYTSYLEKADYYLLFEKDSWENYSWSIGSTQIPGLSKQATADSIYLNDIIKGKIILKSDGIIFVHINQENPKAVIVAVPKDFDKNKLNYDYFVPTECSLKVQIARA